MILYGDKECHRKAGDMYSLRQTENLKWKEKKQTKNREVISSCCSQYPNYNTQQVINFPETYFWFHEGEHRGFGRRRQQAGVWVQNQGGCLKTRREGREGVAGGRRWERRGLMEKAHKITTGPEWMSGCVTLAVTFQLKTSIKPGMLTRWGHSSTRGGVKQGGEGVQLR